MIFDDVIVPLVSGAAGAMALRLVLAAVETLRAPKSSASPSRALGVDRGGPYRAIVEAGYRDHADLALQVEDEAVRRERARMLAIVRAVGERADSDAQRAIVKAVTDGINSGT